MNAVLLLLALFAPLDPGESADVRLIAHRGGVVDRQHIENHLPAIEEAIRRGYWMLEVDIRESKDGQLVVHHDEDFRRFYNDSRRVAEMTWNEIKQLKSTPGNLPPLSFADYAAACRGKIRLMLDTKGDHHEPAFYQAILDTLRENDLLASALVIGNDESRRFFLGKAKVGANAKSLAAAIARGDDVAARYFLFAHADGFDAESIALCHQYRVVAVPSINTFHYPPDKHKARAAADIARLKEKGIAHFQIDSVYEEFCRQD
jgi:glycerophosphoryl diester phosphodiesterase